MLFCSIINGSSFSPPTHAHTASHGTGAAGELAAALFVQNAKCGHFYYQREKQWEIAHFWSAFSCREGCGSWEMASSKLWVTCSAGPGTCPNACCQLCCAWFRLLQRQPGFSPLLSFSPPSAPCVSCTLGAMLWANIFHLHREMDKHPKTSDCGVAAPDTSAEIWHGRFCPKINTSLLLHVEAKTRI